MTNFLHSLRTKRVALVCALLLPALPAFAQAPPSAQRPAAGTSTTASKAPKGFTVEYYYKVKWGGFEEFLELYKRNHYPLLVRQMKMGRILSMSAVYPINHAGEADRWDMRFTIVWKDAAAAFDDFDPDPLVKELYPDRAKFQAEEKRRFELLLAHMDVPVTVEDPYTWSATPAPATQ